MHDFPLAEWGFSIRGDAVKKGRLEREAMVVSDCKSRNKFSLGVGVGIGAG